MKTVYILFGEMGCGKTYRGSRFAEGRGVRFFDGDSVITPKMLEKVSQFKAIPRQILEEYIDVLSESIAKELETCDELVVSQALYMDSDRKNLKVFLECLGYEVRMWWVRVPLWRNVQNLLTRQNGWRWILYWLLNKPFFQKPTHDHDILLNIYEE
jgi:shikimate kinase